MAITLEQAQAQADAILQSLGIARTQFQQRLIDYSTGDARLKELAYLQDLIASLASPTVAGGGARSRCTFATFSRGFGGGCSNWERNSGGC